MPWTPTWKGCNTFFTLGLSGIVHASTLQLCPQVNSSLCPLGRRLHAAQNQSGCDNDEKNLCPYQESNTGYHGCT